jgi:transposase
MPQPPAQSADLPESVDDLKALVREKSVEVEQKSAEAARYKARLEALEEQIRLMRHQQFGVRSEKAPGNQTHLFNEAELAALESEGEEEPVSEVTVTRSVKKRSGGRQALPPELPRVRVEHDLDEADKHCACGCQMVRIGEETSEQLEIIPAQIQVIQNVRFKYACKVCEEGIKSVALPPQPIPKSNAAPGLLAYLITAKFMDALPLHRQETIFRRLGIDLHRATLARWVIRAGQLIQPLLNLLQERINEYDIQHMDETRIQVLKENDRVASAQSQMWVQRGGPPDETIIRYHYDPSRGRAVADRLLEGFQGYVQTDGHSAYQKLRPGIIQVGCWAHARRKFDEALKAQPKGKRSGKAQMGLSFIQKLYAIEKRIADQTPEVRQQQREQLAKPVIEKLQAWMMKSLTEVPPTSKTGKALVYLNNQWPSLLHYLEDGRLNIDNNPAENAIRPFVLGRKNWLFADTPAGAHASAALYSLIETAKANDLEPYQYLRHVFKELPKAQSVSVIESLLPFNIDREKLNQTAAG